MSIERAIYGEMASKATRTINELIQQAICKKLGLEKVRVYDYINRMSKRDQDDTTTCFLDNEAILTVRIVPKEGGIGFNIEHKFG